MTTTSALPALAVFKAPPVALSENFYDLKGHATVECNFSEEEVRRMRGLLDANDPVPADEPAPVKASKSSKSSSSDAQS